MNHTLQHIKQLIGNQRFAEAEQALLGALQQSPDNVAALALLVETYVSGQQLNAALPPVQRLCALQPREPNWRLQQLQILQQLQRDAELQRYARETIKQFPKLIPAYLALGECFDRAGKPDSALKCYRKAQKIAPKDPLLLGHLRFVLQQQGEFDEAIALAERILKQQPDNHEERLNLAVLYNDNNQCEQARIECERVVSRQPANSGGWYMLGLINTWLGDNAAASDAYARMLSPRDDFDAALASDRLLAPEYALADFYECIFTRALMNRFDLLMIAGNYAEAWHSYRHRLRQPNHALRRESIQAPLLDDEAVDGRRLLIVREQGLGDEIMFASALADLQPRLEHCYLECNPKLEALFKRAFPGVTVIAMDPDELVSMRLPTHAENYDCVAASADILRLTRKRPADFVPAAFLQADPERIARWRERLAKLDGGLRVGISWTGGTGNTQLEERSLALEQLALGLPSHVQLVSLQYTDCAVEIAQLQSRHGITVHHWQEAIDDYDETAALVAALDVVVSVFTAVVHLGGALGQRVLCLAPPFATHRWQWQQRDGRSLFYPAVELFPTNRGEGWQQALQAVGQRLAEIDTNE